MSRRVALLLGGTSAEREVSLVTGRACAEALRERGHEVLEIEVGRDIAALVAALTPAPDVVFNALHGRWGEDGCIQGLLELMHIPYTHSGVIASALAMHKQVAKDILAAAGVSSPEGLVVERVRLRDADPMARPYVVKPVNEGSSVGVKIVCQGDNRPVVEDSAWHFGAEVLVERFIPGRELTVGVMGDRALAVTELRPKQGFYDYEAKYTEGRCEHLVPAPLDPEVTEAALETALIAHRQLGCRGVTRSDFRYDDKSGAKGLYWLEINTQPGMTHTSLVPEQAAHVGLSFEELVSWMVENVECDP